MLRYADIELTMDPGTDITPGIDRVYKYLSDRGICREDIDALNLWIVPAKALITQARGTGNSMDSRLAVVFPHYGVGGVPIDWWSARLIDAGLPMGAKGFGALVDRKMGKMFCPPNEPPHAYLVPTLDWTQLKRGDYVYIHESCIKAIAGAKLGFWSIGLNGVRGWSSRKHDLALVDELKGLPWKALQLQPVIVFDSNAADNWDVQHAISSLAAKLEEVTGQRARHILLPAGDTGHWGFDDFCVARGADAARAYLESAHQAEPVEVSAFERLRLELQRKVCVVRSLGRIAEQDTGTLMTRGTFTDVNYAHYVCEGDEGKQVSVPRVWMTDERRVEVEDLRYVPGGEAIVPGEYLNLWRGMGVEPEPGDVGPWLELLEHNVAEASLREWMVQWFAYPLQNLGAKTATFLHLWGPPGTGKQALLAPLMRIYGGNAVIIGKRELSADFNHIYAARQFVNVDELHGGSEAGATAVANKVKMLVTGEKIVVNKKRDPEYEIANCLQAVSTSNYLDSIKLDKDDRRCAVVHYAGAPRWGQPKWEAYWQWVDNGGAEALYAWLLGQDLSQFDPKGWAPGSEHKQEMTRATLSREQAWVEDLMENPDGVLLASKKKVFTTKELAQVCFGDDPAGVTAGKIKVLGMRLTEAGVRKETVWADGGKTRVWIVRDTGADWGPDEIRKELQNKGKY